MWLWDHAACRGTRAAPSPGCAEPPPPWGSLGPCPPQGSSHSAARAAWRPLPSSWGPGVATTRAMPTLGVPGKGWSLASRQGEREDGIKKIIHLLRADGSLNKCPFSIGKLPQGMVLCKEKQQGYLRGQGRWAQGGTAPWEGGLAVGRLRAAGRGRQLAACRLP